ncbi:hypothetical protein EYB26_009224 [Talaromyces marneffei]|uniref:uncharacterized protein n=1 Tax=Talaromyces marneffei TaxID=37727 RepID=UPI0012A9907F|nr:uncharacterized protein EYB26_009224 [Talaromyces marneffei]QGA21513.1 hypothetical protein EYB26_009224 [Talaromyces marneffei]
MDMALSISGVALALPGLIQVSLEFHSRVSEIFQSYLKAVTEAQDQWLLLDIHLSEVEADLLFLRLNANTFQPDIQTRLKAILRLLNKSLGEVIEAFHNAVDATGQVGRLKWTLVVKPRLARLVPEIESWQRRFMDYIQLLRFTGYGFLQQADAGVEEKKSPSAADRLSRDILHARVEEVPIDALEIPPLQNTQDNADRTEALGHTDTKLIWTSNALNGDNILVECRTHGINANIAQLKLSASKVAQILAAAGSQALMTHVLQSVGYAYSPSPKREVQLFLKYPAGLDMPKTLRWALTMTPLPSINTRLELCRQLATAIFYTHTSGLVHKSIRPESILIFQEQQSPEHANLKKDSTGVLFLTGFQLAREATPNTVSSTQGNQNWEYDIYTHPSRHTPGTRYTMAHDIYSLGINLLEIALWGSFLIFDTHERARIFNNEALEGGRLICDNLKAGDKEAGQRMKQLYEMAAKALLPISMGCRFRDIVLDCLGAVERGFGNVDEDSIEKTQNEEEERIGLEYIDKVLEGLEEIRV